MVILHVVKEEREQIQRMIMEVEGKRERKECRKTCRNFHTRGKTYY